MRDFHLAFDGQIPDCPALPDEGILALRQTLIDEEVAEVRAVFQRLQKQSGNETELCQLVHELTDLLYVTYGAILACGVEPDELFAEVHRANMEKLDGPRREDGKVLKPPGWQPADVAGVIARQAAAAKERQKEQ